MSELKVIDLGDIRNAIENDESVCYEYYPKSEVDEVIAKLQADYKEACDRLQTANLIKDEQLTATRHHKYKRCLAMALYCESLMREAFLANPEYVEWLDKWSKRWLEIAERFKEDQ